MRQIEVRFRNITITATMERGKDESGKIPTFGNAAVRVTQNAVRIIEKRMQK